MKCVLTGLKRKYMMAMRHVRCCRQCWWRFSFSGICLIVNRYVITDSVKEFAFPLFRIQPVQDEILLCTLCFSKKINNTENYSDIVSLAVRWQWVINECHLIQFSG